VSSVYSILSYSTFCCEGPSGLQQLRRSCETPLGVWTVSFQPAKVAPPSEVMSSDIAPSAKIVRPLVRCNRHMGRKKTIPRLYRTTYVPSSLLTSIAGSPNHVNLTPRPWIFYSSIYVWWQIEKHSNLLLCAENNLDLQMNELNFPYNFKVYWLDSLPYMEAETSLHCLLYELF
jgi:hypothetical protein